MTEGLSNWSSIGMLLKSHESSPEHTTLMATWKDFEQRLQTGKTIDQAESTLLEAEKRRWRDVLTRLISIMQSLAERNLALRGSANTLHQQHNGNFLKEVELLAKFDPVMKQHIERVESGQFSHSSYLGNLIQNELIASISGKMLDTMVTEIKQSKYYSIILDCTPDVSHQEQMSVIIRTVIMDEAPTIKEHFLGFLVASETTGLGLSSLILNRLKELNIPFDDCRGQSYDNGANMKGRNRGVQARLLQKNPRALYVPCVSHSLNLVVADAAKASTDAISYFGNVQKLYTLFSAAPQRWAILKEHLTIALKSWSDTRWESRVNSIEAVRYQAPNIREALLEVRDKVTDPLTKVEAQSLAEEVGSYRFLICTCDKLCSTLSTGDGGDIDGKELALEITNLPSLPTCEMTALELLSFIHKKNLNELYPNLWIALRIVCTLPVTVASAERSFSKLKLIKTYLRSCMGQDRLTGLAIISINHEIGKQLSYDDIIDDFASKKARKQKF
ncbi:zinc finger MYM-type protein 1-like [Gymnodraco acuticeps]|uniref:Zinc finger MYM-type protein 1-like n=1 Tax=Gymnodraco acuticeps TaxID=8218 RepID=A0A6P8UWA4_GYMAC|nr:zinc finger MYM-type protein 1-like [Gymnodraco acuticeps]